MSLLLVRMNTLIRRRTEDGKEESKGIDVGKETRCDG